MRKKLLYIAMLVCVVLSAVACRIDVDVGDTPDSSHYTKVYEGKYGSTVVCRIKGDTIYWGNSGRSVAYRIDGDYIYSGSFGDALVYRVYRDTVYEGNTGNVKYTIRGDLVYWGNSFTDVAYRIEN